MKKVLNWLRSDAQKAWRWLATNKLAAVSWVGVASGILFVLWFFFSFWFDINNRLWRWFWRVIVQRDFLPANWNLLHATWLFYILLGLALIAGVIYYRRRVANANLRRIQPYPKYDYATGGYVKDEAGHTIYFTDPEVPYRDRIARPVLISGVLLVVVSGFTFWGDTNDQASSYAPSTTFYVQNIHDIPASLRLLAQGASPSQNCALLASHGMPGCIKQGTFDDNWEARVASATGAKAVISRSSSGVSNSRVMTDTLTYIYGNGSVPSAWTAIRDGKSTQPLYGIATWNGVGNASLSCRFTGQYAMNKAFSGRWGNNLKDLIAGMYGNLFYSESDMWGYCKPSPSGGAEEPVIVIPVKEQVAYNHRMTWRAAGVIVVKGSPSGEAQIQHLTSVQPGQFPGPVYPASLAEVQRENLNMMAGRWNRLSRKFGFDTTDATSQAGNASEYLLRNKSDGRLYWVTPLKPRSTDAQSIIAYSEVLADTMSFGSLNQQRVYVLGDDDPEIVNLDNLQTRVIQALSNKEPGFFTGTQPGEIAEFLPIDATTWQVFAERNGLVVYRIRVSSDAQIQPVVTTLNGVTQQPGSGDSGNGTSSCSGDLQSLSNAQLIQCLAEIATELNSREDN